jgi:hypothetical protein
LIGSVSLSVAGPVDVVPGSANVTLCVDRVAMLSVRLVSGIGVIQLFVAVEETAGRAAILTAISLSERPFGRLNLNPAVERRMSSQAAV